MTNESAPESAPVNVATRVVSSKIVELSWQPPPTNTHNGMLVQYRIMVINNNNNNVVNTTSVPSSVTAHNISGLSPFTEYRFQVRAENNAGVGPYSDAVNATTLEDVPGPPFYLNLTSSSSSSITVHVGPPTIHNGILSVYEVMYRPVGDDAPMAVNVSVGGFLSRELTMLEAFVFYEVRVRYYTGAGPGMPAQGVVRTLEGEPSPPLDVQVFSLNFSSLLVEWDQPISPRGIIRYYSIDYVSDGFMSTVNTTGNETSVVLVNLTPFTTYNIALRAFTVAYGNYSSAVMNTTDETIPGPPRNITVHDVMSTSLNVSWTIPEITNGKIVNYTVRIGERRELSETTFLQISGLTPYTNYNISVAASTSAGRGSFTGGLRVETQQDVPLAPRNVRGNSPNSNSLNITWDPPSSLNGVLLTYEVHLEKSSSPFCPLLLNGSTYNTSDVTLMLVELDIFTWYCVAVRSYTAPGFGPFSDVFRIRTDPNAASAPNISIVMVTADEIKISWTAPETPNGNISGYFLTLGNTTVDHTNVTLTYTFTNLSPFSQYTLTVRAYAFSASEDPEETIDGEVATISATTEEDIPGAPGQLMVTRTSVLLVLEWAPPESPNGRLTGYKVYLDGIEKSNLSVQTKYSLLGLFQGGSYNVCVVPVNSKGEGPGVCKEASLEDSPTSTSTPPEVSTTTVTAVFYIPEPFRSDADRYLVLVQPLPNSNPFSVPGSYDEVIKAIQANSLSIPYYIALNETFGSRRRRHEPHRIARAAAPTQEVTLGGQSAGCNASEPCNGPLPPGTMFSLQMDVVDSSGGRFTADQIMVATNPEPTEPPTVPIAAVVAVAVVIVAVVIGVLVGIGIGCFCWWRTRRGKFTPGDLFDNDNVLLTRSGNVKTGQGYFLGPEIVPLNQRQNGSNSLIINNAHSVEMSHEVKLEDLPAHFTSMSADSGYQFSEEYETITDVGLDHSKDSSLLTENRAKNRYTNILAYDHSRVKLSYIDDEQGSDYINGNYIPGYHNRRAYIATQGPLPCTFDDFWRMVWEHNTGVIVMLTKLTERGRTKCHQYWPEKNDIYSDITVTLTKEVTHDEWIVREFDLSLDNRSRSIIHFQYTAWPDHGVPEETEGAISFVKSVRSHVKNEHGPMVVHCSAGVGRTGTFIALDTLLQHIKDNNSVDIFGLACEMRQHRNHMVQTEAQYVFIHKALLQVVQPSTFSSLRKSSYHPLSPTLSEEYDSNYEQSQRTQAERYHMEESII
jgi:protein tyrosine phosphatase